MKRSLDALFEVTPPPPPAARRRTLISTPPDSTHPDQDSPGVVSRPSPVRHGSAAAPPSLPSPAAPLIAASSSGPGYMATTTITLTPREKQLKDLLLGVAAHVDQDLVLRWAGGWVRDKLLGSPSEDIDTAINSMTGETFALHMRHYCDSPENVDKHAIGPTDIGNLHKVAANPDKSKHLETATTRIFGLDVDFVNLRKETYADDSRNPQVEFGTAEEDALRRDATVNALFYNLHTDLVEDFTGGLKDMDARLIRTPMDPFQTFMDDPLRVLRLVRFASRLEFSIDPAAESVMGDARVLNALRLKISRERVGVEVEKMLKGRHPREALALIDRLGLYQTIFTDPADSQPPAPPIRGWASAYSCLDQLAERRTPGSIYDILVRSDEARYFAWVLAALCPWIHHACEADQQKQPGQARPGGTKAAVPLPTKVAREGIKAPNKLCDVITAAQRHRFDIWNMKAAICAGDSGMRERDRVGMAIRSWDSRGGHWRLQVLSALLLDVMEEGASRGSTSTPAGPVDEQPVAEETNFGQVLSGWQKFLDHVEDMDLMDAPSLKRLVDGNQLAKALNIRPGKWMSSALDVCLAWQLRHPGEEDISGAVAEVRTRKQELGIPG